MKAYSYYPGCTLHATAREYDVSTHKVCEALGIELKELEGWICCGASSAHSTSQLLGVSLPAHSLIQAQKKGLPLVTACAMCFSRLKTSAHVLASEETRNLVGQALEEKVEGIPEVVHLLQVLDKEAAALPVKKPLKDLKVACYYGCLLVRPAEVTAFDSVENPQIMDRIVRATGAETLDWGFKTECCGAGTAISRRDIQLKLAYRIIKQAADQGADCIAAACPMCQGNLDFYQAEMLKKLGHTVNMPVLYFTQVVGLALGFSAEELLLGRHLTDPLPMLKSKGLV